MPLIKNQCKGLYSTMDIEATTADISALTELMEGEISIFEDKGSGGTDIAETPVANTRVKLAVNRREDKLGCTVHLNYIKPTKNEDDLYALKNLFDADYDSTLKATGMRIIYQGVING